MLSARARVALLAALLSALAVPAYAGAAAHTGAPAAASRVPDVVLPGDASAAAVSADRATWLVGARAGAAATRIAAAYGALGTGPARGGAYVVAAARARTFAAALRSRGLLAYAEPNVLRRTLQAPRAVGTDPLDNGWRDRVADPTIAPPPVTPTSPLIVLVDAALDLTHPEFASGNVRTLGGIPVTEAHGTATASVAAAPQNGIGLTGLWPGARALNVPLRSRITCSDSANGIAKAIRNKASVINMSYGSALPCRAETDAVQLAVGAGIVPVAAGGNELTAGNPVEYPASLPHVITVAAVDARDRPSSFSNSNAAIDLAAPGEDIPTAVPVALDTEDGAQDGYEYQSGTSFSAPMVSAAIAWVRAARPELLADQAANAVRYSARDVGGKGYDADTGYGVLDVGAALRAKPDLHDPSEPNDDMRWVDGHLFTKPDRLLYRGTGKAVKIEATVDVYEDPADVYRVKVPARGSLALKASPVYGDVSLAAYAPGATSLRDRARRVGRSSHSGGRTERLRIVNRSRAARTFFVAVQPAGRKRLDAGYTLRVGR
jgi:hypothetical protein